MSEAKERILTAAQALFVEGGAQAVTMRAVAERVGVTATALYRHFENKDELLRSVINAGFETFGGYLYRALRGGTPAERMRLSSLAYLDFALEQPQMYRTIFMTSAPESAKAANHGPHAAATFQFLVDRVRECMEASALREDDPTRVAHTIWAQVHGLVSLQLVGAGGFEEKTFRGFYSESLGRLFAGLSPAESSR